MTTTNKANYSIYLTDKMMVNLKIRAAKRKVHVSTIIREAIDDYLEYSK